MKIKEVRDISADELKQKEGALAEELFRLKLRHASGQLESPALMGKVRRDIARIKTVIREREDR
jgi:large subunit ribosomal protein L29